MNEIYSLKILRLIGIFMVLFVASYFRIIMINETILPTPLRNDALGYYNYAVNLKYFGVYSEQWVSDISASLIELVPDNNRPPGYAIFLYPFVVSPPDASMIYTVKLVQALFDVGTVLISFFICRFFLPYGLALFASFLVAISPHLIAMNIYFLSETIFTFTLMLFILVSISGLINRNVFLMFLSGLLLAVALLIKPTMNYFFIFYFVFVFFTCKKNKYNYILSILLGVLIVTVPWAYRNTSTDVENSQGHALVSLKNGSYPGLMVDNKIETKGIPHRTDPNYNNVKTYNDFFVDLKSRAIERPLEYFLWYTINKPIMLFSWDMVVGMGDVYIYYIRYSPYYDYESFKITHAIMKGAHPFVMVSAFSVFLIILISTTRQHISEKHKIVLGFLLTVLFYFLVLHWVVTPLPRYTIPIRPVLYGLSTYMFLFLYRRYKNGK